jgi:UDP-3-O-acyl N-acetylglucosamine deacetylase
MHRSTLNDSVRFAGTGLFSAEPCTLTISPSTNQTGITFHRAGAIIPAHIANLSALPVHPAFAQMKPRCTSVCNESTNIATIEHLLSALVGIGITDADIEIRSQSPHCEIPILDGSALDFVHAFNEIGIQALDSTIEPITITEPIVIQEGDASITIEPSDTPTYSYSIDYPDTPIPSALVTWKGDAQDYTERIAPARTFCLEHEADAMHSAGLFSHLKISDLLVIGDAGPIENTYRHEHECALHKLLDLIGDLALVGQPLCAKISAVKSGHSMAHRAAAMIIEQIN